MSYKFQFSEEAESDVLEGFIWYETQKMGLGEEFLIALDEAEIKIKTNPNSYQIRYKSKVRAFVLDRFPYLILYIINKNTIDVISVFNTNLEPERWKHRVG